MTISIGDTVRHAKHGAGRVERLDRTSFGVVTHAHVRINGALYRVWAEDLDLLTSPPPAFKPVVVRPEPPQAA